MIMEHRLLKARTWIEIDRTALLHNHKQVHQFDTKMKLERDKLEYQKQKEINMRRFCDLLLFFVFKPFAFLYYRHD